MGSTSWVRERGIMAGLVVLTLLAMGRLCAMNFTWWDDDKTIHHNSRMNPPSVETVGYYWTHPHMGLYVPVTYAVWAGLAAVARVDPPDARGIALNPWAFHTANVLVHVANVLLVYAILRLVVKRPWAAGVGAALFAVHPVQVETVGWVSGMKDLLCGTFVLGAVWQYLLYAMGRREGDPGRKPWLHYGAGLALMVLGMLSKPTAVVTPLIVIALDRLVVGRSWSEVAKGAWPWVAAAVPCLIWTKVVQFTAPRGPVWVRPWVALDALAFYAGKLVWPARLAVDYGHSPRQVMETGELYWSWMVPVGIGVALWVWRKRSPVLTAAGVVFVAGVLPVLGITPFRFQQYSTTSDHYLYLSMFGVALAGAWAAARWPTRATGVVAGIVIAVLTVRSIAQAGVWEDDFTLNRNTIAVNPQSFSAEYNLGIALEFRSRELQSEAMRDEAIAHLRRTIEVKPDHVMARSSLATILMRRGETGEGVRLLREAVKYGDELPRESRNEAAPAHFALGLWLSKEGKYAEAVKEYRTALECQPGSKPIEAALAAAEERARGGDLDRREDSSKVGKP